MTDRLSAIRGQVISRGQKPCGCGWKVLHQGAIQWLARCSEHAPMCRSLDSWEIDLCCQPEAAS